MPSFCLAFEHEKLKSGQFQSFLKLELASFAVCRELEMHYNIHVLIY